MKKVEQGKGIQEQIKDCGEYSPNLTYKGLVEIVDKLDKEHVDVPIRIPAVYLLAMDDKMFKNFWKNNKQYEVWGGSDAFKRIDERAKELGLEV